MIDRILERNRKFVESKSYHEYTATKIPKFKTALVSCMDARLVHLLPAALGLEDGDVVLIQNAGGRLTDPYGETMRALLVAIYELGVEDVVFIGHTDCGAQKISAEGMIGHMLQRGVPKETIERLEKEEDLDGWLAGFVSSEDAVTSSIRLLSNHPLHPESVHIHGFVIDIVTGELTRVRRSEHLQTAGHPVDLRFGCRPYADARGRPGGDLCPARIGHHHGVQPATPGLVHVADHLLHVRHLENDLLLTAVHPLRERLAVLVLRPDSTLHGRVTDLCGDLSLSHVEIGPHQYHELIVLSRAEESECHATSIAVQYLKLAHDRTMVALHPGAAICEPVIVSVQIGHHADASERCDVTGHHPLPVEVEL